MIADSRKILNETKLPKPFIVKLNSEAPKPEQELLLKSLGNVKPLNYYFEDVPNVFVTRFITENACLEQKHLNDLTKDFVISSLLNY